MKKYLRAACLALILALCLPCAPASGDAGVYAMPNYIGVDLTNQVVTVYRTADNAVLRQMLCSSGAHNTTPIGTFYMPFPDRKKDRKEWTYYYNFRCYVQYPSRIRGDILFHSLPYRRRSHEYIQQEALSTFGYPTSHGCIRLRWQDARFISDNCPQGTKVVIYESGKEDQELRNLLYQSSYSLDSGMSYESFLAVPDAGELGRYSESGEVSDLQYRLRDLGYFAGEPTGVYLSDTIVAVKQVQAALGMPQTGTATQALLEAVYGSDAPAAMNVTLREGANGPAVKLLQGNLRTLGLYGGDMDSVLDLEVSDAVSRFQSVYGYAPDGIATPEIQKAIGYEANRVKLLFPEAEDLAVRSEEFTLDFGRVNAKNGLRIRQSASTQSEPLERLSLGSLVLCMERGEEWSKVKSGSCVGYVPNTWLDDEPRQMRALVFSCPGRDDYVVGRSKEDYQAGAAMPAEIFAEYLASDGSLDNFPDLQLYATVNTGDDATTLNLREAPSAEGAILAALTNGTEVRVKARLAEYTQVEYGDGAGYLMNRYLDFRAEKRTPEEMAEAAREAEAEAAEMAGQGALRVMVNSSYMDEAPIYDLDSDDAQVMGHLKTGVYVELLESVDGWSHIRYQDRTGYMRDEDLIIMDDGSAVA